MGKTNVENLKLEKQAQHIVHHGKYALNIIHKTSCYPSHFSFPKYESCMKYVCYA